MADMKASVYPAALQPLFMGTDYPGKKDYGAQFSNGNMGYFQNFRNETISRMQVPKYEWGSIDIPYTPSVTIYSEKYSKFPQSDISMLDRARQAEVDDFYMACQKHRTQYKAGNSNLHPLDYFKLPDYAFQCPTDPTSVYMKYPTRYVRYKQPITLPVTLERSLRTPLLPDRALTGVYERTSYKGR